jgi:hypothetical protein
MRIEQFKAHIATKHDDEAWEDSGKEQDDDQEADEDGSEGQENNAEE